MDTNSQLDQEHLWPEHELQPAGSVQPTHLPGKAKVDIDLQALAQRIYALLREDLRITRERSG